MKNITDYDKLNITTSQRTRKDHHITSKIYLFDSSSSFSHKASLSFVKLRKATKKNGGDIGYLRIFTKLNEALRSFTNYLVSIVTKFVV